MAIGGGQYIIAACGEFHLEQFMVDFLESYVKIEGLTSSEPICSFMETILNIIPKHTPELLISIDIQNKIDFLNH